MTTPQRSQPDPRPESPQPVRSDAALTRAFALLGEPWNGLIIAALAKGPAGFTEGRERVPGIDDDTLAQRLQDLTTVDPGTGAPPGEGLTSTGRAALP
jgi:DNA-binding HxlR family transcriptional regulator